MPHVRRWTSLVFATTSLAAAPAARADPPEHEPDDPIYFDASVEPLAAIDCEEHEDVGYVKGDPFTITVVTVDGKPVEVETANAYYQIQQAAAKDGVGLKIVSGFRTMAEQEYFYNCYINCNCNNCNEAAKPGFSNHQSGHALDLNTGAAGVLNWLNAHGPSYGFTRTVPSEDWHWEWWGGGPPANGPCGTPGYGAEYVAQSFPPASQPAIEVAVGSCIEAWIDLRNTGDEPWNGDTRLAPTPRDAESPLHDANTWLSPTRIATPAAEVAPGAVGRFAFRLCPSATGEVFQTFGLVQEGVTWFADDGGPPDTQLEVRILGVPPTPPPPPPPPPPTTSGGSDPTLGGDSFGGGGEGGEGGESSGDGPDGSASGGSWGGTGGAYEPAGCGCRERPAPGGALALLGVLALRRRRTRR